MPNLGIVSPPLYRRVGLVAVGLSVLVAAAVLVVLQAVGAGQPGKATAVVVHGRGVHVGALPPDFEATTVDGRHIHLRDLRGRVVLLNFFATWCSNCRAEAPLLEDLARRDGPRGLSVVAVDWHDSGDARAFLRELGVTYPAILDSASAIGDAYALTDLPETVWIGRDGRVAAIFHGQLSASTVADILGPLLAS